MAQMSRPAAVPPRTAGADASDVSYVDWPAILAGAVLAAAIAFVLSAFGAAIGLTLVSPFGGEGIGGMGMLIALGLWSIWVIVSSFMAGGYLAGRLRRRLHDATPHEVEIRDGAHGLIVWAVGVVIGAVLVASGAYQTARVGAETASAAVEAVGDENGLPLRYLSDALLRTERTPPAQAAGTDDEALHGEVLRIFQRSITTGSVSEDDRTYLASLVANRTGMSEQEANARVDQTVSRFQTLVREAQEAIDTARQGAVVAAFVLAASLLIAAAGAWVAAGIGGRHRDEHTMVGFLGRRT
jgi:hypothetical protein